MGGTAIRPLKEETIKTEAMCWELAILGQDRGEEMLLAWPATNHTVPPNQ